MSEETDFEALKKIAEELYPTNTEELDKIINESPLPEKFLIPFGEGFITYEFHLHRTKKEDNVHLEYDTPLPKEKADIVYVDNINRKITLNNFDELVALSKKFGLNIKEEIINYQLLYIELFAAHLALGDEITTKEDSDNISSEMQTDQTFLPKIQNNILIFYTWDYSRKAEIDLWEVKWNLVTLRYEKNKIGTIKG